MYQPHGVQVQSVARAMEILDCFTGPAETLGITELSAMLALSKSTVYGLVNTLVACGMLEKTASGKQYRLGIKLFQYGMLVRKRMDLQRDARPFCVELAWKYGLTVHLAAKYGNEIVYIDKVDAPDAVIAYSHTGKCAPPHCTGVGKAILAFLPEQEGKKLLESKGMPRFTEHTMTSYEQLSVQLQEIRAYGYAMDREEIELGLRCVAAPIFGQDESAPIAAISISGPAMKLPEDRIEEISKDVMNCAGRISARLGYFKKES